MSMQKKEKEENIDYSLISFPMKFESKIRSKTYDFTFRQLKFKEVRDFGNLVNPDMKISNKMDRLLELLSDVVLKPSKKKFIKWFENLFEEEFEKFIVEFSKAKESERKK